MGPVHSFTFVRYAAIVAAFPLAAAAQQVFTATGAAGDVQAQLGAFRASLGGALNPNVPGSFGAGRREINWDAVPDTFSAPNAFPGDGVCAMLQEGRPAKAKGKEFVSDISPGNFHYSRQPDVDQAASVVDKAGDDDGAGAPLFGGYQPGRARHCG